MVKKLIGAGKYYGYLLDEFFQAGRHVCVYSNPIKPAVRAEIVAYLLETGLKLYDARGESKVLQYDLQYQLTWLFNDLVVKDESYAEVTAKYEERVAEATAGFDYFKRPD